MLVLRRVPQQKKLFWFWCDYRSDPSTWHPQYPSAAPSPWNRRAWQDAFWDAFKTHGCPCRDPKQGGRTAKNPHRCHLSSPPVGVMLQQIPCWVANERVPNATYQILQTASDLPPAKAKGKRPASKAAPNISDANSGSNVDHLTVFHWKSLWFCDQLRSPPVPWGWWRQLSWDWLRSYPVRYHWWHWWLSQWYGSWMSPPSTSWEKRWLRTIQPCERCPGVSWNKRSQKCPCESHIFCTVMYSLYQFSFHQLKKRICSLN